jgi:hypothetical protein
VKIRVALQKILDKNTRYLCLTHSAGWDKIQKRVKLSQSNCVKCVLNNNVNGRLSMESSSTGSAPVPFMQQMLHNKMLMLTVLIAVSAVAYFGIGLYMLLRH